MWLQIEQLPIKVGLQNDPLQFQSLAKIFKTNIYSLVLLLHGLRKVKTQYRVLDEKDIFYLS